MERRVAPFDRWHRRDDIIGAALDDAELRIAEDRSLESHAAGAENAALLVEEDHVAQVHALAQRAPLLVGARAPLAGVECEVLESALARFVTNRAIERVVLQEELEDHPARLVGGLARREHQHSLLAHRAAGDGEPARHLAGALHLDLAHAAAPSIPIPG